MILTLFFSIHTCHTFSSRLFGLLPLAVSLLSISGTDWSILPFHLSLLLIFLSPSATIFLSQSLFQDGFSSCNLYSFWYVVISFCLFVTVLSVALCLSVCLYVCMSVCLSMCMSIYLSFCVYLSVCLATCNLSSC